MDIGVCDVNTPAWQKAGYEPFVEQFWPRIIALAGAIPDPSRRMEDEADAAGQAFLSSTVAGKWTDLIEAARKLKSNPPVFLSNSTNIETAAAEIIAVGDEVITVQLNLHSDLAASMHSSCSSSDSLAFQMSDELRRSCRFRV